MTKVSLKMPYYDKALKIDPNFFEALNNKGNALRQIGKYNDAIKCFEKAISLDDRDPQLWINLGVTYYTQQKEKKAIECYDRL